MKIRAIKSALFGFRPSPDQGKVRRRHALSWRTKGWPCLPRYDRDLYAHALRCGPLPENCIIAPVAQGVGFVLGHDILHPETMEPVAFEGFRLNAGDVAALVSIGVDYLTVRLDC